MKLLSLIIFFVHLVAVKSVQKCGRVTAGCVKMLSDGTCSKTELCLPGFKRKLSDEGCCCFLRDSYFPRGDDKKKTFLLQFINFLFISELPSNWVELKTKILTETLDFIDKTFTKVKSNVETDHEAHEVVKSKIDEASKTISDTMVSSLKKLAKLVDVDYLKLLSNIFGDESSENSEKIELISNEALQIYEKGESSFMYFDKIIEGYLD